MNRAVDAVVVGAGVIGAASAYYLSEAGLEVTLLDMRDVAGGTSSACDGNVLLIDKMPGYDARITAASLTLLSDLARSLDLDFEFRQFGSTLAVETEAQMDVARAWVSRQQAAGLPFAILKQDELLSEAPELARDIVGGVLCNADGSLSPMKLVYALVEGVRRNGGQVRSFCEVTGIRRRASGSLEAVETTSGVVTTRCAVLCAGVWTPILGRMAGIEIPVKPRKGHILVAASGPQPYWRKMMEFGYLMTKFGGEGRRNVPPDMEKYGVAMVYEPTPSGNFLIGSSREFVGFDTTCDSNVLSLMARRAMRFFPGISGTSVIRSYAGLRPYTPDHLPIVSAIEQVPGLYVATGHEGDGIGLAAVTGKLIAAMVCGQTPLVDPAPLSLSRFAG